ncbi:hypothetical protein [Streptomyces sp. RFCAC02]|uniref:hypothetical protein n=1 Tax=Streptomyces sp. RFCAC02 TaxID=2499143 RepID=UPI0032094F3B
MLGGQTVPEWGVDELMESSVENGEIVATGGHWMGATVGAALFVSLLGVLGLAVGTMLRHSAGAITTMFGVVLLPLVVSLFMFGESLQDLRQTLIDVSLVNGLAQMFRTPMGDDQTATGWPYLAVLAVISVGALVLAHTRFTSTDA